MRDEDAGGATDYPESRPAHAEAMALDDAVRMATETSVKYYGIHTSSRAAAEVLETYQKDKSRIRGETCTHYCTLDDDVYGEQGMLPVIAPPLRRPDDIEAMFEYLKQGVLDVVSTDHVAFTREQKQTENWWDSEYGANSIQRSLPVFHDEAVNRRGLSYPFLVRVMATNPARTFGLRNKGDLSVGSDADFVIFDPDATQTIDSVTNYSNADFSLYEGRELTGKVDRTYVRGELVAEDDDIVCDPGYGQFVERPIPDWEQ